MFNLSESSYYWLSCLRGKCRLHRQVVFRKLPKQLLDNILFLTFYTGLFLLSRKKTGGGARAPPAPPLATALQSYHLLVCKYMASASASNELRELPMTKPLVLLSERGEFEQRFSVFILIDRKLSRPICGHANPRPSCRTVLRTVSIFN